MGNHSKVAEHAKIKRTGRKHCRNRKTIIEICFYQGQPVALKKRNPDQEQSSNDGIRKEIEMLQLCEDKGIRNVKRMISHNEERTEFVMPLAECSLLEYLKREENRHGLNPQEVLRLMKSMLDTLSMLHGDKDKILNRDMKPGNILLFKNPNGSGYVFIMADFDSSRVFKDEGEDISIMGTPTEGNMPSTISLQYAQSGTERKLALTSDEVTMNDLFSFAAVLYHAVTGRRYFEIEGLRHLTPQKQCEVLGTACKKLEEHGKGFAFRGIVVDGELEVSSLQFIEELDCPRLPRWLKHVVCCLLNDIWHGKSVRRIFNYATALANINTIVVNAPYSLLSVDYADLRQLSYVKDNFPFVFGYTEGRYHVITKSFAKLMRQSDFSDLNEDCIVLPENFQYIIAFCPEANNSSDAKIKEEKNAILLMDQHAECKRCITNTRSIVDERLSKLVSAVTYLKDAAAKDPNTADLYSELTSMLEKLRFLQTENLSITIDAGNFSPSETFRFLQENNLCQRKNEVAYAQLERLQSQISKPIIEKTLQQCFMQIIYAHKRLPEIENAINRSLLVAKEIVASHVTSGIETLAVNSDTSKRKRLILTQKFGQLLKAIDKLNASQDADAEFA